MCPSSLYRGSYLSHSLVNSSHYAWILANRFHQWYNASACAVELFQASEMVSILTVGHKVGEFPGDCGMVGGFCITLLCRCNHIPWTWWSIKFDLVHGLVESPRTCCWWLLSICWVTCCITWWQKTSLGQTEQAWHGVLVFITKPLSW